MVFAEQQAEDASKTLNELSGEIKHDLEQKKRELEEITMLIEQSQLEVNKLTQRNATATSHLQQLHGYFDSAPRGDIRTIYDAALDTQQRLFVMRGQLEKLQSDQKHLKEYIARTEQILQMLELAPSPQKGGAKGAAFGTVEAIIQAQEAERQRLSRQMHDGPAQALSNFILQTEIAMRLFDINTDQARAELENLKQSATATFQKVRDFIFELRPMMLDDLGLVPTLKRYVEAFKEQSDSPDVQLSVTGVERRLESYIEVMIFRAIQELIGNAARHSQASQITVKIDISDTNIRVDVDDNGKGFDIDTLLESGMGVKVIKERVEMLGGHLDISSAIGRGSKISFQIPAVATSQSVFA